MYQPKTTKSALLISVRIFHIIILFLISKRQWSPHYHCFRFPLTGKSLIPSSLLNLLPYMTIMRVNIFHLSFQLLATMSSSILLMPNPFSKTDMIIMVKLLLFLTRQFVLPTDLIKLYTTLLPFQLQLLSIWFNT